MKIKNYAWLLAIALIACESDDDTTPDFEGTDPEKSYVVVGNQGGFGANNASITLYDIADEVATQEMFSTANDGEVLGDVLQSIYHYNDEVYVVLNNSAKVEVLNDSTFEKARTIEGLGSPRFMLFLSDEKAYITDWSYGGTAHSIHIVNPSNGTYLGAINTDYWVENMILHDGEVWITSPDAGKVVIVNPETDTVTEEIAVAENATDILEDANGMIWVLCQGVWGGEEPSLFKIDPETKTVETSFVFPSGTGFGGFMQASATNEELLILMAGELFKMNIDATALPVESFIARTGQLFYGVSVNRESGDIFLSDAVDYSSAGVVYIYTAEGTLKSEFDGGVVPWMSFWE